MIDIPEGNWWDWDVWDVRARDPGRFVLCADFDLTYHHNLEVVFTDPVYVQCPSFFHEPVFREATEAEWKFVGDQVGAPVAVLVAFEADADQAEPETCLIGAGAVEVVEGTVLRYWRDDADMEPGWRRASWVRPPGG